MKHTSFELAKQVYDKGVRIETHFDTDPADGTIYSKEEIIEFGIDATDFIPSPTLCEWLEDRKSVV